MGKSGIETASCDSRWTKKRGFARILARYEVCMPSRRLLSIVLRSARDVTLQLAVLIRAPSKLVWCASVYLVYTGVTIVARATVARCSFFFFFSLPLSFSRTFSDTIPRRAKVLRLFRPVTGDECRLSYPWTVSIGRNINKVIEGEWHGNILDVAHVRTYVYSWLMINPFGVDSVCCRITSRVMINVQDCAFTIFE